MKRLSILFLVGDVCLLYLSLVAALVLRMGQLQGGVLMDHFKLFTPLFVLWLIVFVILKLDEPEMFKRPRDFIQRLTVAAAVNCGVAILVFYFLPLPLAPKTNLILTSVIYFLLVFVWHTILGRTFYRRKPVDVILIGEEQRYGRLIKELEANPQLNVRVKGVFDLRKINWELVQNHENQLFLFSRDVDAREAAKAIFEHLGPEQPVMSLIDFYEEYFGRVLIEELTEEAILREFVRRGNAADRVKRTVDIVATMCAVTVLSPLLPFIALGILLSSSGPILFTQDRIGYLGKRFTLYKFRTMHAEGAPQWSRADDSRVFPFGKLLRRLHLDELPQAISILKGDLSIVGPRPEQIPIVRELERAIPFYQLRHLVKPGVTGWAQLQFRYAASVEESKTKLEYDLFYLKHHSVFFDLWVILKTISLFGKEFNR